MGMTVSFLWRYVRLRHS